VKGKLSTVFAIAMVVAMLLAAVIPAAAAPAAAPTFDQSPHFTEVTDVTALTSGVVVEPKDAVGPATYIVHLNNVPLASYQGGIEGLTATNPEARGETKLDASSADSVAYMDYLAAERATAINATEAALGREIVVEYEYTAVLNGFATELTPAEAAKVAKLPNVRIVQRDKEFELQTDAGPAWIGAPGIWDGSMTGGLPGTMGEGIVVGVIDTGIDPWNPSFADVGDDGYDHTNPKGKYFGVCDPENTNPPPGVSPYDPTFPCNDKVIGAWGYASVDGGDPRDSDGHGSHTSSTAAGNFVNEAVVNTPAGTYTAAISGVAPHANIIMYAACCTGAALSAARDQVVLDGVDAVNYSIGASGATNDPWNDTFALQWLAVRDAGIFVATSAGNAGPGDETVGSPGDLPWMTTVGASSHNRAYVNSITVDDGVNGPLTLNGQALTGGLDVPAEVVRSIDFADPDNGISVEDANLCADGVFPAGTFDGQIVVCERGVYGRVAKGQTVAAGGAGGYILAQPNEFGGGPGAVTSDPHVLPAVHIDYYAYQDLLTYLDNAGGAVMGTITAATKNMDAANGDIMAAFSSRGANRGFFSDLIVPKVTAPGRAIWAAYHQGAGGDGTYTWNVIQGTSMSSPHVAGAGALMVAVHPDWTPAEIESALMTTANTAVLNDDGVNKATPFAQGAGAVKLGKAAQAGVVLDVTTDQFTGSDPRQGGDPKTLNIANMGNSSCVLECSWTRTLTSVLDTDEDWTAMLDLPEGMTGSVEPANFTLAAGGTQDVTVTVNVGGLEAETWYFAELKLDAASETTSDAHMPIAVSPNTGDLPDMVDIETGRSAGSQPITDLTSIPITEMTIEVSGLAKGDQHDFELFEDPTNGDPYDNLDDVWWMTFDAPDGASRIVSEIIASAAPDIDLFVGMGDTPSAATQIASSTTGSWNEYIDLQDPDAGGYWVLAQSWGGSAAQPDAVSMVLAVVAGDSGNMVVTGPDSVEALEPFDLRLFWNDDMMTGDRWYGAFTIGTDPANPGNVGFVPVDLMRVEDDVTKAASVTEAGAKDVVEYTITVQPNIMHEDLAYTITDTLPAGVTYVDGSAMASDGTVSVADGVVTWTGTMPTFFGVEGKYNITTSADDPTCDTGFGGYVNLAAYGIMPQSGISGDSKAWRAFSSQNPVQFYGGSRTNGIAFTDDGFAYFDSTPGDAPWTNTMLPDAADPNDLMALFWNDMEIIYSGDPADLRGVSLASAGSGISIIEYDGMQPWTSDGVHDDRYDFEVVVYSTIDNTPGAPEIVFAYDNFIGSPASATIGVENLTGTTASEFLFGDPAGVISDGLMVCFDYDGPTAAPTVITYQATVDADAEIGSEITNTAVHNTDLPGSMEASASASFMVIQKVLEGSITQTPSADPLVYGDTVAVDVNLLNETNEDIVDGSAIVWLDDEVTYVDGSAYNATPLTAMQAADLLARMGQEVPAALNDAMAGDEVIGILWEGMLADGDSTDFGFVGMVNSTTGSIMHAVNVFNGYMPIGTFVSDALEITETATVELPLLADTWVSGGDTGANHDGYAALVARTSGLDNILLTFDRSALPEGANLISAELMVKVTLESGAFGKELTVLNTEPFDSTTVTYDTAPAVYNPGAAVPAAVGMMSFDVATNVAAWDAVGAQAIADQHMDTLAISASGPWGRISMDSLEAFEAKAPTLMVTYFVE
jgi:uncharacterized repeat protein (TIGR01451 family)